MTEVYLVQVSEEERETCAASASTLFHLAEVLSSEKIKDQAHVLSSLSARMMRSVPVRFADKEVPV